jgi:hypothetical protein
MGGDPVIAWVARALCGHRTHPVAESMAADIIHWSDIDEANAEPRSDHPGTGIRRRGRSLGTG